MDSDSAVSPQITAKILNKKSNKQVPIFLVKMFDLLENCEHPNVISWSSNGKSIVIKDSAFFTKEILPSLFNHSNLSSFIRQLNMYNFRKMKVENECELIYSHPSFQKAKGELLHQVERKKNYYRRNKDPSVLTSDSSNSEKDFDSLEYENTMLKRAHREIQEQLQMALKSVSELEQNQQKLMQQLSCQRQDQNNFGTYKNDGLYPNQQPQFYNPNQLRNYAPTIPNVAAYNNFYYELSRCSTDKETVDSFNRNEGSVYSVDQNNNNITDQAPEKFNQSQNIRVNTSPCVQIGGNDQAKSLSLAQAEIFDVEEWKNFIRLFDDDEEESRSSLPLALLQSKRNPLYIPSGTNMDHTTCSSE